MDGIEGAAVPVAASEELRAARTCLSCPKTITRQSKSGMCGPCATRANRTDPVKEARRIAGLRAVNKTPEFLAKKSAARRRVDLERKDDPIWQAYKRASGQRLRAAYDADPAAQAANKSKRASVGRQLSDRWLAWCPPERRAEYQRFRAKVGAAEARRVIEASMTPLERQLARVRAGARVITKFVAPRADHVFTLGGVASGLI